MSEVLELNFRYKGAIIEGYATAEEDYNGWTYAIELNDQLQFRIYQDDNEDWVMLRDQNAISPNVEEELLQKVINQIEKRKLIA